MIRFCLLACWILTFSTVALQSTQYALLGEMVTFMPAVKTPPDEILWKHKGNKVVEFNGNEEIVYVPFQKRITLDWHAAVLEIKQLTHGDSGEYELDVFTKKGLKRFNFALEVIDRVAKPIISCKMNNGSSGSDKSGNEATLMCSGDSSQSQSLTFEWSQHGTVYLGPILKILLGKEYDDQVYSCTVSNRLSKEMSTFTAKDCYLVNRTAGLSAGLSAAIGLIVILCVLGVLGLVCCKLKHKACFAKEKTKDVEHQPAPREPDDHTSKPLLDRLPTAPSTQRLRPLPGMSGNNNCNQNDDETDEDTGTGLVKRYTRKFENKQKPSETGKDELKKTQLQVAEKPFNGNLAQNGEADAEPHREEPEKTVLANDHLEGHSGATQLDLQPFSSSELPDLEISKNVNKKPGPPVAEKPPFTVNLARNKVSETKPWQEAMEKNGLECSPLDEHSGATKPDLQTSTVSEKPASENEEDEEAPNTVPADEHKEEKQDAIPDQVTEETEEENESNDMSEKEKSSATDELTDLEKNMNKKPGPPVAEKPPFPVNLARNKVSETKPWQEAMEKNGLECSPLDEHSGATKPDLQTSTVSEKP